MANTEVITQGSSGLASGAMAGAGIGLAVGGPAGAVAGAFIGAGVGLVTGTVTGLFSSNKKKKQKKYARLASQVQSQREENAVYSQYLQDVRTMRISRGQAVAEGVYGGLSTSSLLTSALSSQGSQLGYNIQTLAEDRRLFDLYKSYMQLANKNAEAYQTTVALGNTMNSLYQAAGTVGFSYATYQAALGKGGTGLPTQTRGLIIKPPEMPAEIAAIRG